MAVSMDKKNLAAGVKEMRSVAKKLLAWADDLEKASAPASPDVAAPAVGGAAGVKPAKAVKEEPAPDTPPTLAAVKKFLSEKCAAGYSAQVQALIASFGAKTLSGVPEGSLGALLDAALLLGEEGEDANAG
jgi:hypothetical protein